MKKSLYSIVLLLSILVSGRSAIAQQHFSLLDSLDYCSKYTLKVSIYHCFTRADFAIEVYKNEQGHYMLYCNTNKLSLSPQGCQMQYARLSDAQFNRIRQFEMNLDKGHEHKQSCRSTTFVNIGFNNSKKHFQHCGCGSSAYLEIKDILLTNQN